MVVERLSRGRSDREMGVDWGRRVLLDGWMQRVLISEGGPEFSRLVYGTWRFLDDPSSCSPEQVLERIKALMTCSSLRKRGKNSHKYSIYGLLM